MDFTFFNFLVPIFRADIKWLLLFLFPYFFLLLNIFIDFNFDDDTLELIFILPFLITRFIFPFIYNGFYTKDLLAKGYLPPEDDDYSNAILKGNGYLEYTNKELLDKEKMERYKIIIENYEKERQKDRISVITFFGLIGVLILFFIFMINFR